VTDAADPGRRELAYAVIACLLGAGLGYLAWTRAGGDLGPWLRPLALVGLAGAGALLATRGPLRTVVGGLVTACGLGIVAAAPYAWSRNAAPGWPAVAALGGLALAAGGALALVRGRRWPAMGARYERRRREPDAGGRGSGTLQTWEALDRGEDPTSD
jgi:hypothetical protein